MRGTMSILGLLEIVPTLLDSLIIPETLDADLCKDRIILECAELETIYPEPDFYSYAIERWSKSRLPVWERMIKAIELEYNPLENYDRIEEWTDNDTTENTVTSENESAIGRNHTDDNYNYVHGYNDNSQVLQSSQESRGGSTDKSTAKGSGKENGTKDSVHNGRIHGNIGVTTSQQMLAAELDIAQRIDMYEVIAREFRNKFCILIY